MQLTVSNVERSVFDNLETCRNQPFKQVGQQRLLFPAE